MRQPPKIVTGLYLAVLLGWKDLLMRFHSRIMLVFVVVLPLAMVFLTGQAFKGFEPRKLDLKIALEDNDHGDIARRLRELLEGSPELLGQASTGQVQLGAERSARVQFLPQA